MKCTRHRCQLASCRIFAIAWRSPSWPSFGRRQVVEGANAMLKGGFVNIGHKFFRVFGLTKITLLLAFTVFGCASSASARSWPGKRRRRPKRRSRASGPSEDRDMDRHRVEALVDRARPPVWLNHPPTRTHLLILGVISMT
jgi:hypothetical protein